MNSWRRYWYVKYISLCRRYYRKGDIEGEKKISMSHKKIALFFSLISVIFSLWAAVFAATSSNCVTSHYSSRSKMLE